MLKNIILVIIIFGAMSCSKAPSPSADNQKTERHKAEKKTGHYENLLFPQGSPPAQTVNIVEVVGFTKDEKLTATTLQGIVNAGPESRIYYHLAENTNDRLWLDYMQKKGYVENVEEITFDKALEKYSSYFDAVIVYDPELPASINIGTMMASLQKAIVTGPDHAGKFQNKDVIDLAGRWQSNAEAYQWAWENLWPEMNQTVLCCYHPTACKHQIRDYLVRNKIFTFWITGPGYEDGVKSDHEKEKEFAEKVFANTAPNIPVIGFWYSGRDSGIEEYTGVGLAGKYGKLTVPCDWTSNMSFLSGVEVDFKKAVTDYKERLNKNRTPLTLDEEKVYICFDIVDSGDAPVYWQCDQYFVWQDPERGKLPINYAVGPTTMELIPPILQWYFENATAKDYFYMGLSGACYTAPYREFMSLTDNPEAAWSEYLGLTQQYMDRLSLSEISLYTDAWEVYDRAEQDATTMKFVNHLKGLEALILGLGRDEHITEKSPHYFLGENNVLVSHVATRWDPQNIGRNPDNNQWLVEEIRKNTPTYRPAFMHVHPLSWSYYPSDMLEVLKTLGPEYEAVTISQFNELYRRLPGKLTP